MTRTKADTIAAAAFGFASTALICVATIIAATSLVKAQTITLPGQQDNWSNPTGSQYGVPAYNSGQGKGTNPLGGPMGSVSSNPGSAASMSGSGVPGNATGQQTTTTNTLRK